MSSNYLEIETLPRLISILDLVGMQRFSPKEGVEQVIWTLKRNCNRRGTWNRSRPDIQQEESIIYDRETNWGKKLPKFEHSKHKAESEIIVSMICLAYKLVGYPSAVTEDKGFKLNVYSNTAQFIMWKEGQVIPPKKMVKLLFGQSIDANISKDISSIRHDKQTKNVLKQQRYRR